MIDWSRMSVLGVATVLLVTSAIRISQEGATDGYAMLAAGLICLGSWITMEIIASNERKKNNDHNDKKPDEH